MLVQDDGSPLTYKVVRKWMRAAQRRSGLDATGNVHILRHTYCSLLAMANVPALTIQRQAGHQQMSTTNQYLHLSQSSGIDSIRLLEEFRERERQRLAKEAAAQVSLVGEILEKEARNEETP